MKKILLASIICILGLASCIHRDLEECETADLLVRIYVERFGDEQAFSRSESYVETSEPYFNTRIEDMDYYLYKDNVLIESGSFSDALRTEGVYYTFRRNDIPWGNYKLALMANCVEDVVTGSPDNLDEMSIVYSGVGETEDYFIDVLPFSITQNALHEYDTQLKRLHGVVRYNLINVDPEITAVEVSMDGLTRSGCIMGTYSEDFDYSKTIYVNSGESRAAVIGDPNIVATFPTMEGRKSSWSIKIYKDDPDVPFYERTISSDVEVVRNRLLDLSMKLEKDNYSFEIKVNTDWDGTTEGGTIIIY